MKFAIEYFAKIIGIKGAIIIGLLVALGFLTLRINHVKADLQAKTDYEQVLVASLKSTTAHLVAIKAVREDENSAAIASFEGLQAACDSRVKETVRIVTLPQVSPASPELCPSIAASDVQGVLP